jgi:putative hydroxymethylpyrimidine transporter CytX
MLGVQGKNNVTTWNYICLWFGASVSVAEMMTGGLLTPLGFRQGILAIVAGHLIGTTILVFGGIIGTENRMPALMSTRISFGSYGSHLFSVLNILQLVGWTAVMIISGARSINQMSKMLWEIDNIMLWCVAVGLLILLWVIFGKEGWKRLNMIAVVLLFGLTVLLSTVVFADPGLLQKPVAGEMSFGGAMELSVVMPLSWLPLIADYTRFAATRRGGAVGSWLGYFAGSCWMYAIGLGAALAAGNSDPGAMMLAANLGLAALGIVILSTITTTFLDAYSAGVTFLNIFPRLNERTVAGFMTVLGTVIAATVNIEQYENFLLAIGSVFAPLFAVLLTDYFLLGNQTIREDVLVNWGAVLVWATGVTLYYRFIALDFILGATVPVMVITGLLYWVCRGFTAGWVIKKPTTLIR